MIAFDFFFAIAAGFLVGSIMFSQILPQRVLGTDIAAVSDDHNPGATNVFINCGTGLGLICLALDIAKGFIPVLLACRYLDTENMLFGLVLAAPVLGHAIAPLHHFHGGKCIATSFGVLLGLIPVNQVVIVLAVLYILFSTVLKIQSTRIRSIVTFSLFGLISAAVLIVAGDYSIALGCGLIAVTAIVKHSKPFCN